MLHNFIGHIKMWYYSWNYFTLHYHLVR